MCVPVGLIVALAVTAVIVYVTSKTYESTKIVEVKPVGSVIPPEGEGDALDSGSQFLLQQAGGIKSREVMLKATEEGDFAKKWGLSSQEATAKLERSVSVTQLAGTDLFSIRAVSENREDARDITHAVTVAYRDHLRRMKDAYRDESLKQVVQAIRAQEEKLEESRKKYVKLRNKEDSLHGKTRSSSEEEDYQQRKQEFEANQKTLQTLKLRYMTEKVSVSMMEEILVVHEAP